MLKALKTHALFLSVIAVFALSLRASLAAEDLSSACELSKIEAYCQGAEKEQCKAMLEKCESFYQQQSDAIEKDLSKTKEEKNTLQSKISTLAKKITNLNYQISQSNVVIADLKIQISDTDKSIAETSSKIGKTTEQLRDILKTINEKDNQSIVEVLFSEKELSGFYNDLTSLEVLNLKNKELLTEIKKLKVNLEDSKVALDEERGGLEQMVKIQTLQKVENDKVKKEQEQSLKLTEKEYQKQLQLKAETAKKAAQIRARIFELSGVSKAPTFGEAYEIAKYASSLTNVRPAFLLAILTQESNIGKNVGQCYLSDTITGAGKNIKTGAAVSKVMSPKRDIPPFLVITKDVGRNFQATPVSCPMSFGWGGAMGPAQFIPSTWSLYQDRLRNALGRPADPWNIRDAFVAAALYLADSGANKGKSDSEWRAALAYFSGSTTNTKYRFYADSVIRIASGYEDDIKEIEAQIANK